MSSEHLPSESCHSQDLLLAALDQSGLTAFNSCLPSHAESGKDFSSAIECDREWKSPMPPVEAPTRKSKSYTRITVGGRKFLIPVDNKKGLPQKSLASSFKETTRPPDCTGSDAQEFSSAECKNISREVFQTKNKSSKCDPSPLPTSTSRPMLQTVQVNQVASVDKVTSADNKIFLPEEKEEVRNFLPEEEEEVEEIADTYADYKPTKLSIGLPHPDPVVETSSLSSIPPPDIFYKLSIPEETIDHGWLSSLQLESISYACQKHLQILPSGERAGFLIGDGAGVGKGRTIAGIIFENYLLGRKRALWLSVSNDLKYDSERDLCDIGAKNIQVHSLNKFKYRKISSKENCCVKKGVIFATYASLISESHSDVKYGTRLKQILHWCGSNFDGVIVFDECHKAKNLMPSGSTKPTKTGFAVMELQKRLPNARIVYASATGASEPRNMAYMSRIGLWGKGTAFADFGDFIQAVERRGVGAMELVAMDLKSRGSYIARQLSFQGVTFRIEEVKLSDRFIEMYNKAVGLWTMAKEAFEVAVDIFGAEYHMKKTMWGQFWGAHQRFFKYLCIAAKVERASQIAREAVKHGKCVVIGLQSTGESQTLDLLEKNGVLDDFVSTARGVFQNLIERHFPAPDRKRVTELFGKDFYQVKETVSKTDKKSNLSSEVNEPTAEVSHQIDTTQRIPSYSGCDTLSETSNESLDISDEDICKIFGAESDCEEWGPAVRETKKKACKRRTKNFSTKTKIEDKPLKMNVPSGCCKESREPVMCSLALSDRDPISKVQALKQELLEKLEFLYLPNNALDDLIDKLGGSENVAEMTGRKGRMVHTDKGQIRYQSRSEREINCNFLNITEKQRFMDGEKNIAIISEASSSGISLHSDRRVRNQRRRLHITLELPWSADRAVQQFGRTHRSNQVSAPDYLFLITELAGETRFASTVAKRLESMGALTHGDRRATETRDLSRYNFDNKYGRIALDMMMKSLTRSTQSITAVPLNYPGDFYSDIRTALHGVGLISPETLLGSSQLEKESCTMGKFLNRILGMKVMQQNAVFSYFSDMMAAVVKQAKADGQLDHGIKDIGSNQDLVEHVDTKCFRLKFDKNGCYGDGSSLEVKLHTVKVDRGMSWEKAQSVYSEACTSAHDGFYLSRSRRNGSLVAILCTEDLRTNTFSKAKKCEEFMVCRVYRPHIGKHTRESYSTLCISFEKASADSAKEWWLKQYHTSLHSCSHKYLQGSCHFWNSSCTVGKRQLTYRILSGTVFAVWKIVEHVLAQATTHHHRIQIVRFIAKDGNRLVGLLIPEHCTGMLIKFLCSSYSVPHLKLSDGENQSLEQTSWESASNDDAEMEVSPDNFISSVLFPRYLPSQ